MNLVRWEPLNELVTLRQAMDKLFADSFVRMPHESDGADGVFAPAMDIYETPDKIGVKASMPGVKPENIDISIDQDTLLIKGETKSEQETKDEKYVRRECRYGTFSRSVALPAGLKIDKAEATMENGVLTLEIPKAEEVKPRTVKIKAKAEPKKIEAKETKENKN